MKAAATPSTPRRRATRRRLTLRTLADVMPGADVFLGCSTGGVLTQDMVRGMATRPIILALANPEPEIRPELAKAARPDCIIATGRSDYPNQVNNVLCFPYIFRGALDCGATKITAEMKLACVKELSELAKAEVSEEVASAYAGQELQFGDDYIIPKPFDSRLILRIAPAVAAAAAASGVATRPITDMDAYRAQLTRMFSTTGMLTRPVFSAAKTSTRKRVALAEGEDPRVLRAAQIALDEDLATPMLIGRPSVIEARIAKAGLRMRLGKDITCVNPDDDPRFRQYWQTYHRIMGRRGVSPEAAKAAVHRSTTTIAALMVQTGRCGRHALRRARPLRRAPGEHRGCDRPGRRRNGAGNAQRAVHGQAHAVHRRHLRQRDARPPNCWRASRCSPPIEVRRFGLVPKVAFLSHSNYGSSQPRVGDARARGLRGVPAPGAGRGMRWRDARRRGAARGHPQGKPDGQPAAWRGQHPDLPQHRCGQHPLQRVEGGQRAVHRRWDPSSWASAAPAHVLTPSSTVRRVLNMMALVAAQAGQQHVVQAFGRRCGDAERYSPSQ